MFVPLRSNKFCVRKGIYYCVYIFVIYFAYYLYYCVVIYETSKHSVQKYAYEISIIAHFTPQKVQTFSSI